MPCLSLLQSRIGDRVRKIRTDITPYSHSSGLPLLFFFSDGSYSRSVGVSLHWWVIYPDDEKKLTNVKCCFVFSNIKRGKIIGKSLFTLYNSIGAPRAAWPRPRSVVGKHWPPIHSWDSTPLLFIRSIWEYGIRSKNNRRVSPPRCPLFVGSHFFVN